MTQKYFIFDIGPNDLDNNAENLRQLHEIISAYFPPNEFSEPHTNHSSHFQTFYNARKFWIGKGEEVFARSHAEQITANTQYLIDLRYEDDTVQLPHEENKTLSDFISEITSLPSYSFTHDVS